MAYSVLRARLRDGESDPKFQTVPFYLPAGQTLAAYQTWADGALPILDGVTHSLITELTVEVPLTIVGGMKAEPVPATQNEHGGNISFTTTGPRKSSFRIPNILWSIMAGDSFDPTQSPVLELVNLLNSVQFGQRPRTEQDYQFIAALSGSKSQRKK